MALHIHCSTDDAVLLVAVACPDGLLRFPNDDTTWPGLGLRVDPVMGINEQLVNRAGREFTPELTSQMAVWQNYSDVIAGDREVTLYVAMLRPTEQQMLSLPETWKDWQTLPALIRTLPKDRTRLAYLKAWQVLTGALEETTKAVDVHEVARYLKSLDDT